MEPALLSPFVNNALSIGNRCRMSIHSGNDQKNDKGIGISKNNKSESMNTNSDALLSEGKLGHDRLT